MTKNKAQANQRLPDLGRRKFLKVSAASALAGTLPATALLASGTAQAIETRARIVIVGAGAAGISLASRLTKAIRNPDITIIDAREAHYYQPGLTLVAVGAWKDVNKLVDKNERYLPRSVKWVKESVAAFDPDHNRVFTHSGTSVPYDYLLVATGVEIRFDLVDGLNPNLIGQHGIACVYDTPEHGAATARVINELVERGGKALMTRPITAIKCAGAPVKIALLTEHRLREANTRSNVDMHYLSAEPALFSQPDINQFLYEHMPKRGIAIRNRHELVAIDPGRKHATFRTEDGEITEDYDFIHAVPPMTAPSPVRESALAWQDGPFVGWLEVDRHTLQHTRYGNVFGVGDVVGTPVGKTAASVKAQVPVAVTNLLARIQGQTTLPARYDGYTSCPLITERGKAILVEFDYELKMVPSFGFINPYQEHWVPWILKDKMLQAAYQAMLRGRV
ncbi:MAG: FAD-dependent oxidoreductase [Marinobacter sp.]|nr:FAD-dependent oxidoreductase [Marinobacter sp.]